MRYFCRVEYDGTNYGGWQSQVNRASIQSELQQACTTVLRKTCKIVGAGRTDAGVHARGQGMHIDGLENIDCTRSEKSINAVLPPDIAIYNLQPVESSFHARYAAVERCYKYYFVFRKMPLWFNRAKMITHAVDWNVVNEQCACLLGQHDFTAFCASGSTTRHNVCTVTQVGFEDVGEVKIFTIKADRFVYKMVRSIVGTLIDIGRGVITDSLKSILDDKERNRVGNTSAAHGLVLDYVKYGEVQ